MGTALQGPTERELRIAMALRAKAAEKINRVGAQEASTRLGLSPSGVRSLLWKREWSLETAFRVADALGIDTDEIEMVVHSD